jgi:hypothetical protein
MLRAIAAVSLALAVSLAWAEGPGSRIGTTPEIPQPSNVAAPRTPQKPAKPCETLRGDARDRCLREQADIERRTSGPEATGMGSGASGTTSGTSGGGSLGGGTPR